ncbi:hypothetical protein [Shewanella violacea]|nr:hypothetical protein [Shewanella violacea]
MNSTLCNRIIFIGFIMCLLPSTSFSKVEVETSPSSHFFIKKGIEREVCQDFLNHLNENVQLYLSRPRYFISEGNVVFRAPPKVLASEEYYIRASIQSLLKDKFGMDGYEGWFKQMEGIKNNLNNEMQIYITNIDINNEGTLDRVLVASYRNPRYGYINNNYVLNSEGDLAAHFQVGAVSHGELFLYKGKIYGYSDMRTYVSIIEFTPAYHRNVTNKQTHKDIIGLQAGTSLCKLQPLSKINN